MNHNLLDLKNRQLFDSKEGKNCYIKSVVDYSRTMQYKVYISYGYGVNETIVEEMIFKSNVDEFIKRFYKILHLKKITPMEVENEVTPKQEEEVKVSPKEILNQKNMQEESKETNFFKMQSILLKTMEGLQSGNIKPEQAKSISLVAQTLINSVKVESEVSKIKGVKLQMLQ